MKKLFTLLLAVAASVGTMFAWDYERVQIGDLYYNLDATSQTAQVTSQNSSNPYWSTTIATANIPSSVEYNSVTYTVTTIGDYAFLDCSGLTSVTIPNSVTSIGDYAFQFCRSLTSPVYNTHVFAYMPESYSGAYTIPDGIESIAGGAFYGCIGLTSVTIPNSVTSIGEAAFNRCTGLTSINVASDNSNYCSVDGVLFNKDKTTLIQYPGGKQGAYTIPNSVTSIGNYAFYYCSGLTSVTIPNSVTSIGNQAFYVCTGLTSVTIGNSVTSIGDYAFRDCSGLTSPVYNAHVFAYMPTSYSGAYTIPEGIESIAGHAFAYCRGLTSVTIPNSVTSIGGSAFRGCSSLTSVTIPNSVTSIGSYAFDNVPNIVYTGTATGSPWGARSLNGYIDGYLVYSDKAKTNLLACFSAATGDITIPNSVTSIGSSAFWGCSGLTSVTIPNSVTSIGDYAFYGCIGLTSVTIPNSVTSIGYRAFYGCSGLTSPVYNAHVFAFMPTSYSGAYTIPDGIESIAGGAFYGCSGLTSVMIPNSVTSIGNYAFYKCSGLISITCEAITPPTLGSDVFSSVDKSIPLYVPAESVEAYQTADQWKDFTNIIGLDDGDVEESNIRYIDPSNNELGSETVSLHLPDVPEIEGFTFLKWQVVAGDLEEGIIIQAVYQADESTSASSVYTNPANPAQKLIRNGNVYILSNEKTYSITGAEVK